MSRGPERVRTATASGSSSAVEHPWIIRARESEPEFALRIGSAIHGPRLVAKLMALSVALLVVPWLSPALVALAVSEALVVELVDVAAAVRVAMVSTPRQPGLGLFPMVLAPPRVLKVTFRPLRGLYPPALGLSLVREHCLALDPALPSTGLPPGGPPVESLLALPAVEFLCSSSPSWASMAWGLS